MPISRVITRIERTPKILMVAGGAVAVLGLLLVATSVFIGDARLVWMMISGFVLLIIGIFTMGWAQQIEDRRGWRR